MTLQDFTDQEFEALSERMYDSVECQQAFVEANAGDVEIYLLERGIDPDYYCDHELDYCEADSDRFMEFAYNYFNRGGK
jgi:hypothetical protein